MIIPPSSYVVPTPPLRLAESKRDVVSSTLRSQGRVVVDGPGDDMLTIGQLAVSDSVTVRTGATAEFDDALSGPVVRGGRIPFEGLFDPLDRSGTPEMFTAGIVTEAGEMTERVSAADLSFQTDGPIICQALFQRLAPRAPACGAHISFATDRLEVYFDPACTVTRGGVVFGTTSTSEGCAGSVTFQTCGGVADCSGHGICIAPNQSQRDAVWSVASCSDLLVQWGASCLGSDNDHEVYEGTIGSYYSHAAALCTTGGSLNATLTPGSGGRYYLVVPRNASREGSFGTRSNGTERPQGSPACQPSLVGTCGP